MKKSSVIILSALVLSACAGTDTTTGEEQASAQPWGEDEGDLVCRYERTIGSRIGTRVCRTQEEIDAAEAAGQEALENWAFELDEDRTVTGN